MIGSDPASYSLRLDRVSKHYGVVRAVDDVSLEIERGEFLTLLGPSGSGKTTLLMIVAGFIAPNAGEVLLGGKPITHLAPEKRELGMVFQGYALFPHMTVAENIAFPLKVRRQAVEAIRDKVDKMLELVQLTGFADRLPRQLSGGQQQRVALARAMSFSPEILLLDEPLGALDRKLRTEMQVELKQLHQRLGTTFVYVTHDQEEALSMSDRIVILRDGKCIQIGDPEELYEKPASRFVASFLGESNFMKGAVEGTDNGAVRYGVAGRTFRQAAKGVDLAKGDDILIAMRPEKIGLSAAEPGGDVNSVLGEIVNWNYFGSNFHFTFAAEGIGDLAVTTPAWQCTIRPEVGGKVWLTWSDDASVIVEED